MDFPFLLMRQSGLNSANKSHERYSLGEEPEKDR